MAGSCRCSESGGIRAAVITVSDTEINRIFAWFGGSGEVVVYDQWQKEKDRFVMTMPTTWEYADEIQPVLLAAIDKYVTEFKRNPPHRNSLERWENNYWFGG
jgi:hypothetical protein